MDGIGRSNFRLAGHVPIIPMVINVCKWSNLPENRPSNSPRDIFRITMAYGPEMGVPPNHACW